MKKILGISAFYHDSAAALLVDGEIIAAAQEERFTREKHCANFPVNAIQYCLQEAKLSLAQLDAIVFYEKPLLKFERLLDTYLAFAPRGFVTFAKSIPVWLNEKLFLKSTIYKELEAIGTVDKTKQKLLFSEHHLSHAASAFFCSPFKNAAVLTIDGVGEWTTASIGLGNGSTFKMLKELHFPHSVGLLYSSFTYFLGFKVNAGEYKVMGLAPFASADEPLVRRYIKIIKDNLVEIKSDGSLHLNMSFFNYGTGLTMIKRKKWENLLHLQFRKDNDPIQFEHCCLAQAVQLITNEVVVKLAAEAQQLTKSENLCMAGGVALNCVANTAVQSAGIFKNIFVQPAAGDAGGAIGAALAAHYLYFEQERTVDATSDSMRGALLGPSYTDAEVLAMNKRYGAVVVAHIEQDTVYKDVAQLLNTGNVVGWFQGRMEFGPRALGNRSILADARSEKMLQVLNQKIKQRENFRPFAPAVLAEDAALFFETNIASNYMLFVAPVKAERRLFPAASDPVFNPTMLASQVRSDIPAVTHFDYSARYQTVDKKLNVEFWNLLTAFKEKSGIGLLVNTSFNVRGEPIVCSPDDAYRCFMNSEMDYLVINNFVYSKREQPDFVNKGKWERKFILD